MVAPHFRTADEADFIFRAADAFGRLVAAGRIEIWHLLAVAFLLGIVFAFDIPARQSFLSLRDA